VSTVGSQHRGRLTARRGDGRCVYHGPGDMTPTLGTDKPARAQEAFQLSPQQVAYFDTFGFLMLPGLFKDDVEEIVAGFERIFADESNTRMETHHPLHGEQRRVIILSFIDKDPCLRQLRQDSRVLGIVNSLIGERNEYAESDGSIFYCESSWHADIYGAPMHKYHVKLSFYLDPLFAESGAIRMIPGTNHFQETFATTLRTNLEDPLGIGAVYGVDGAEIPSFALASNPGDVVVWNYRTLHASYNGGDRRRLFSISFREPSTANER
jgi:Phytanoyl-CoA dioxygenase (PhyH)